MTEEEVKAFLAEMDEDGMPGVIDDGEYPAEIVDAKIITKSDGSKIMVVLEFAVDTPDGLEEAAKFYTLKVREGSKFVHKKNLQKFLIRDLDRLDLHLARWEDLPEVLGLAIGIPVVLEFSTKNEFQNINIGKRLEAKAKGDDDETPF